MDLLNVSKQRYTTKADDPAKKIPQEQFERLLQILRLAPSSINIQPWHYFIADNDAAKQRIAKALVGKYIDELQSGEETLYFEPYRIRVTADTLNVRSESGTQNPVTAKINWGDVYTITDSRETDGAVWGKLNSSAGWVNLDFTENV